MNASETSTSEPSPPIAALARCLDCSTPLGGSELCPHCGRNYPVEGGILEAIGELTGNNRVAADFYNGPSWAKFRKWERLFLGLVGGRVKARREILRYLPDRPGCRVLEVGIGDGENLDLLPVDWAVYGVDLARSQLAACSKRYPKMIDRLARSEAERLPFADAQFDACYSIGGFNYFRDPASALSEMHRVTRAEGVVLVADERPDLKRFGLGHLIGLPRFDAWWMRSVGLPANFVAMVLATQIDLSTLMGRMSPTAARQPIWRGLGYLLVDPQPSWNPS